MTVLVVRGDARRLPLTDASVDLVCTSPPYFALRSYTDNGEHYDGQVGSEATPAGFLAALWEVTAECVRVLKPGGSMFVNLGDKYAGSGGHNNSNLTDKYVERECPACGEQTARMHCHAGCGVPLRKVAATRRSAPDRYNQASDGIRPKSLMGLPWRYAIGCIDHLGLILRAEIVWSKPNGLPESVTDRVRRSHEQWFHLTKEPRYYAAVDEVREAYSARTLEQEEIDRRSGASKATFNAPHDFGIQSARSVTKVSPLGALPGSVQTVATEPLSVPAHLGDHFAAFPSWWPRWIIKGWSPPGICVECGEGRRPVVDRDYADVQPIASTDKAHAAEQGNTFSTRALGRASLSATVTGEACACPTPDAPTRPAVILDPFGGTGTTALMADALGRHAVTVDLSADYCALADWRIFESGQGPRLLAKHEGRRPVVGLPQRSHPTLFGAL